VSRGGLIAGLAAALAALALAGCGAEDAEDAAPGSTAAEPQGPPPATTELTVRFMPEGPAGPAREATLTCDPPGGSHPKPEAACTVLASNADALVPVPADVACTQIYGGPQQAVIAGTFRGHRIWTLVKATDGCQIARAKRLAFLLPGFSAAAGS
jgi:hypothetical protein